MSEVKNKVSPDKYLVANEYEANEHGAFIYTSASGNHKVEMSAVLEDYHYESSKDNMEEIDELTKEVAHLKVDIIDLKLEISDLEEDTDNAQIEVEKGTKGFTATTLIDEKRLEILRRMYKHLSLDELQAVEAPFKLRAGYLDINY